MSIMGMGEILTEVGTRLATYMVYYTMLEKFIPQRLRDLIESYIHKILGYRYRDIRVTINEFTEDFSGKRNQAYVTIEAYLSTKSPKDATRFRAQVGENKKLVLTMDDYEDIHDEFQGVKLLWSVQRTSQETKVRSSSSSTTVSDDKRCLVLYFHEKYRDKIMDSYLNEVMEKGKELLIRNRQRKLYSNGKDPTYSYLRVMLWNHVVLDHPATFDNLAMNPIKKKLIIDDLIAFSKGKDYYTKVGKAWKRGYLLYGPPGTGKSTMVASIANFLNYDIYDLELTSVKGNNELRKLLLETSNKSVVVIEDIDCTISLTNDRNKKFKKDDKDDKYEKQKISTGVTLSGLLNFIDGLWSTCGSERIIIFTTNHIKRLDPALIRRGRMDMHIEMSYCCFEGFKVLAKNYLDIDSHILFDDIKCLISETEITPADVAENLMPKNIDEDQTETCLKTLIQVLEKKKEEQAILKAEKEKKQNEDGEAAEENSGLTEKEETREEDGVDNEDSSEDSSDYDSSDWD